MTLATSCPDGDPFLVSLLTLSRRYHALLRPTFAHLRSLFPPSLLFPALPVRITLACPGIGHQCDIFGSTLAICVWELERVLLVW